MRPLIFWILVGVSLMSITHEGCKLELLRSAPISMSDILKGKFWATWVPLVVAWVLVFLP